MTQKLIPKEECCQKMVKKLTKQDIINWATNREWKLDKYGHLQKKINDKEYRFKLSSTALRYEVKVHHLGTQYSKPSSEWVRIRSGYYKDLYIGDNSKLSGLRI